jgi:D-beta-D-heptose 7-phosphate kinase/D-beta-D-heptose 1-phosphate adenosyltransferase
MTNSSEIAAFMAGLPSARILCVGDLMLDRFVTGSVNRVSPEAPIPVLEVQDEAVMIGGAGNVVRNLVAFGAAAELVAVVGDDQAGTELTSLLNDTSGADAYLEVVEGRRTTIKTRFMTGGQQLLRADYEAPGVLDDAVRTPVKSATLSPWPRTQGNRLWLIQKATTTGSIAVRRY